MQMRRGPGRSERDTNPKSVAVRARLYDFRFGNVGMSMYAAFGDKQLVFHRVMERYREGRMTYIRQALAQPSLRQVLAGLIHRTAEFLGSPANPRACLLIQGALACGTDAEPVFASSLLAIFRGRKKCRQQERNRIRLFL
jgi:AcrR family transcriptional regulator